MKIATFNVNSLKMRLPVVANWCATAAPDILALQEIKGTDLPETEILAMGYHTAADTQKSYNGVATLSRAPARIVGTRLDEFQQDDQARIMITDHECPLLCPRGPLRVVNIYAPNGNPTGTPKYAYKIKWLQALYHQIKSWRSDLIDFVILGDFNIIPTPICAARPADWTQDALFQKEVRDLYRAILALGMTDCLRAVHGADTPNLYSFWDYQAGAWPRNNGILIDHILASPRMADRLVTAGVDRTPRGGESPSDHTPVFAEFSS